MAKKTSYWLIKSEPDVYSIADLERDGRSPWDGIRNYQARNFMMHEMAPGDGVLYYHSSADPPGIAGIARVATEAYPDPTQFDRQSRYFDAKSTREKPRWWLVDVEFVERFPVELPLPFLREQAALDGMALLRKGQRLSIQPVTAAEWKTVRNLAARAAKRGL